MPTVTNWTFSGNMWHDPGTPPMEIAGKSRFKSIMDGRFLIEKVEADEFMGQIFKGMGITGYDNLTQTFVGTWIDNMGTGILRSQGTASGDGKTIHYTTDHPDLITGQYIQCRAIEKINGPDEFVYTAYNTTPDGQEFKQMELTYTRIK